ncbi:uncharacterized protein LOC114279829 [Camellia sinensis]|uniref:uncharacterized protein LOC114279829 n=1 Tax=Camellia sinensis TaxID=4442 RepID=UPI001035B76D|nr:uncharacterized protein LOC114279829 [Camellia sinensis]
MSKVLQPHTEKFDFSLCQLLHYRILLYLSRLSSKTSLMNKIRNCDATCILIKVQQCKAAALDDIGSSDDGGEGEVAPPVNRRKSSFWSVFRAQKSKECKEEREDGKSKIEIEAEKNYAHQVMMMRSRFVYVPIASDSSTENMRSSSVKSRGLYFPSPIKFFQQSKTSKVVQERSPLYRG